MDSYAVVANLRLGLDRVELGLVRRGVGRAVRSGDVEGGLDLSGDLLGRAGVGVDHHRRDLPVDRPPAFHQGLPLGARVAQQQRARHVEPDARRGVRERDVQEDDDAAVAHVCGQVALGVRVQHGATTEREDPVVHLERGLHGCAFELAEAWRVVGLEEVGELVDDDGVEDLLRRRLQP